MRDIIINYRKVYDTGETYRKESDNINKIQNNLKNISKVLNDNWNDDASHNLIESFDAHIYALNNIKNFLDGYEKLFKTIATGHDEIDSKYISELERSVQDELNS